MTVEEDVKEAIEKTVATFGTIHVALPCAGVSWPMLTYSESRGPLDMKLYRKVIEINLYGSVHVAKYASLAMSKN